MKRSILDPCLLHKLLVNDWVIVRTQTSNRLLCYARRGRNSAHLIYGVFLGVSEIFVGSLLSCGVG